MLPFLAIFLNFYPFYTSIATNEDPINWSQFVARSKWGVHRGDFVEKRV